MKKEHIRNTAFYVGCGLLIGFAVAILNPGQQPLIGFLTGSFLGGGCAYLLGWAIRAMQGSQQLRWATVISFALRLAVGFTLFFTLPIFGYDEPPPRSGYLYLDAFQRDSDAWALAESSTSLASAFQNEFSTDQYGGLLSLSGALYRYLSPDAHRPLLVLILTAFFSSFGLPFFWAAVRSRLDEKTANTSSWLYALYPESVILGASQMREPILIGLSAVAFWGVAAWRHDRKKSLLALIPSVLGLIFISFKAGPALVLALAVWFWLINILPNTNRRWRILSYALLLAVILGGIYLNWGWFLDSSKWDLHVMESSSGRVQYEIDLMGGEIRTPFIIAYGLAQPVLPATIIYPGIPIMRTIAILRAFGWYVLTPLLLAASILVWKAQTRENKRTLLYFMLLTVVWIVLSSARAGGDQWDNPRYRSIFLVWMLFLAGWAWVETARRRSPWLWRLAALELIYVGYFIHWYASRYYGVFKRMMFWDMIRLLGVIGVVMIAGGIAFDLVYNRFRKRRK